MGDIFPCTADNKVDVDNGSPIIRGITTINNLSTINLYNVLLTALLSQSRLTADPRRKKETSDSLLMGVVGVSDLRSLP